jgi:hypothetical protein
MSKIRYVGKFNRVDVYVALTQIQPRKRRANLKVVAGFDHKENAVLSRNINLDHLDQDLARIREMYKTKFAAAGGVTWYENVEV